MPRTANAGRCSTKDKGAHTKKGMKDVHGDILEKARKQGLPLQSLGAWVHVEDTHVACVPIFAFKFFLAHQPLVCATNTRDPVPSQCHSGA